MNDKFWQMPYDLSLAMCAIVLALSLLGAWALLRWGFKKPQQIRDASVKSDARTLCGTWYILEKDETLSHLRLVLIQFGNEKRSVIYLPAKHPSAPEIFRMRKNDVLQFEFSNERAPRMSKKEMLAYVRIKKYEPPLGA